MQYFVSRGELTGAADELVHILGSFDDGAVVDPATLGGSDITVMFMPSQAVQISASPSTPPDSSAGPIMPVTPNIPYLVKTWRVDFATNVLAGEANKRIVAVFPEYSQRNANAEINNYITAYGAVVSSWPAYQQSRKAEIDRCWAYVNDVRAKANAMGGAPLPVDPTADGQWPTVISPYVPS
jgi:hypothetical protein